MSERGMMRVTAADGTKSDLIPFVGIKPRQMASALSRMLSTHVSYEKHEPKGGGNVA